MNNSFKLRCRENGWSDFAGSRFGNFWFAASGAEDDSGKVNLHTSRDRTETYSYEIANDSFLTPLLLNITLFNTITSSERALGDSTISVKGEIKIKGQESIQIDRRFSAKQLTDHGSGLDCAPVSSLLTSGFDDVQLDGITLDISSSETKYAGTLERITLDRTEVRRGEKIEVQAYVELSRASSLCNGFRCRFRKMRAGPVAGVCWRWWRFAGRITGEVVCAAGSEPAGASHQHREEERSSVCEAVSDHKRSGDWNQRAAEFAAVNGCDFE
jgi:hypothetical protein